MIASSRNVYSSFCSCQRITHSRYQRVLSLSMPTSLHCREGCLTHSSFRHGSPGHLVARGGQHASRGSCTGHLVQVLRTSICGDIECLAHELRLRSCLASAYWMQQCDGMTWSPLRKSSWPGIPCTRSQCTARHLTAGSITCVSPLSLLFAFVSTLTLFRPSLTWLFSPAYTSTVIYYQTNTQISAHSWPCRCASRDCSTMELQACMSHGCPSRTSSNFT